MCVAVEFVENEHMRKRLLGLTKRFFYMMKIGKSIIWKWQSIIVNG